MTVFDSKFVIAGGYNGEVRIVNLSTGDCVYMLDSHLDASNALVHINLMKTLNDDLLFSGNPWIRLVSLSQLGGDTGRVFEGHRSNVTSLDIESTSSNWFISGGEDGLLRIWDVRAKGFQTGIEHSAGISKNGQLHPNQGSFIFGDANGFVNEWDLAANRIFRKSIIGSDPVGLGVHCMAIDHRRNTVCCSHNNREVSVFDLNHISNNNESNHINLIEETTPTSIATSVVSTQKNCVQKFASDVHSSYITNIHMGNTFESLAISSGDGSVSVWRTHDNMWTLDNIMKESNLGKNEWCWDALFIDQEERFVLSAHADGVCNLWDTARHVPTPIASYDCGGGKTVKSILVVGDYSINPAILDRRHRLVTVVPHHHSVRLIMTQSVSMQPDDKQKSGRRPSSLLDCMPSKLRIPFEMKT